jgi:hypothetical protein
LFQYCSSRVKGLYTELCGFITAVPCAYGTAVC